MQARVRIRHRGEQQLRVRMHRPLQHLVRRPVLDDLARVHDEHVVRDVARAREVVRHVEKRDVPVALQIEDQVEDPEPDRDVEHRRRLVGEDHLRLDRERARNGDALALAAGELVRVLLRDLLGRHEPDRVEQLVHAVEHVGLRHDPVDQQRPRDVVVDALGRIERRERVLEDHLHARAVLEQFLLPVHRADVLAAVEDRAAGRCVQARDETRDRALAAAALADECRHGALLQREGDVVDGAQHLPVQQRRARDREALREPLHVEGALRSRYSRHAHRSSVRWQATRWPGSTSRSTGRSVVWRAYSARLAGSQCVQRVWKRQPAGGFARSGGEPGMPAIRSSGPDSGGNELHQPDRVRMQRPLEQHVRRSGLDDLARVHDRDPVAELDEQRQVVRDEEDGEAEVALEVLHPLEDLALDDDVERRRRLVHDHQLRPERKRHRDDRALAHAARELVRVRADMTAIHADELHQLGRARQGVVFRDLPVRLHHVDELVADAHQGVERVHRALEDHRDVAPAELPHLLLAQLRQVLAAEQHLPARQLRGRAEQLHDRRSRSCSCRSRTRPQGRRSRPCRR